MQASRITPPLMGVGKTRAQPAVEPVGGQPSRGGAPADDLRGLSETAHVSAPHANHKHGQARQYRSLVGKFQEDAARSRPVAGPVIRHAHRYAGPVSFL